MDEIEIQRSRRDDIASTEWRFIIPDNTSTATVRTIEIWMEALAFHLEKAKDYQGAEQELGPLAQFVDMSRKWVKIKNALWFGQRLTGPEKVPEILFDLMAHIGLTLRMIKYPGDKPWRVDVHGSNYEWPDVPTPGS